MKRLIMLAVLCAFVLSAAAASAADIKASGAFVADAVWQSNWDFSKDNAAADSTRTFDINQRTDLTFQFVASENLKGVFNIRTQEYWGRGGQGVGGTTSTIQVRKAYLDFNWPGTSVNVKVGHQGIALPNAVGGSYIFDTRTGALTVGGSISDNAGYLVGFLRAASSATVAESNLDFYVAAVPLTFDGFTVAPFVVYGGHGENTGVDSSYWLGVSSTISMLDPITIGADFNYGSWDAEADAADASGFYLAVSGEYAMDSMTPEALFVYTSGEDDDAANGSERMPTISPDWGIGSFFFGGDAFLKGSLNDMTNFLGFMAVGASLKDIASFTEGLTHTAHLIYARGTNDENATGMVYGSSLTTEDSLIELDFNTYYKLYDELTVGVELGYVNLNLDKDTWGGDDGGSAYKISTGIAYKF